MYNSSGPVPPHDKGAEGALLAAIMRDPDKYLRVGDIVGVADFYFDAHKKILLAIESVYRGGAVPDLVTVASEIRRDGYLEDVGGDEYLFDVYQLDPTGANGAHHAGIVRDLAIRRRVIHAASETLRDASNPRRPTGEILGGMSEALASIKGRAERGVETQSDFEFVNLSTMKARPVKWAVPGRIPRGSVTLIAGFGGSGKSTLIRSYIAAITTGRCAFGMRYDPDPPGNVLMIAVEDDYETSVIPHLIAEGANLLRVDQPFHLKVEKGKRTHVHMRPEHTEKLKEYISRLPVKPHTLYIDPIASFSGRAGINEAKAAEVRGVIDPLSDLAIETGMAVIVVAHLNKGSGDGPASNRIAGSRAYVDAVRLAYILGEHPDDPETRVAVPEKKNVFGVNQTAATFKLEPLATVEAYELRHHSAVADLDDADFATLAKDLSRVRFGENETVSANDLMTKPKDGGKKLDRCIEWLRGYLKDYAFPSLEIEAAAAKERFGKDTLWKARTKLKDEGLRWEKDGPKKFWWGMGPEALWKRRPEPATSTSTSKTSETSGSSGSSLFASDVPDVPEPPELLEDLEVNEGTSRSVAEHLADEKAKPNRKRKASKPKTATAPMAKPNDKPVRLFELAKELDIEAKQLLTYCKELGFSEVKNQLMPLTNDQADALRNQCKLGSKRKAAKS